MGRTRGQSQRLQDESDQRQRVIEDAVSAAAQKWTEFGSILANTSTKIITLVRPRGGQGIQAWTLQTPITYIR